MPIFGMSRDDNKMAKNSDCTSGSFSKYNNTFCQNAALSTTCSIRLRKCTIRILQAVDNAVFWQNVLLYFENDPLSPSF